MSIRTASRSIKEAHSPGQKFFFLTLHLHSSLIDNIFPISLLLYKISPPARPKTMSTRFENLDVDDLVTPRTRIAWTPYSTNKILAFCAEHQISDHNRPTPAQLITLMHYLNAPESHPAAWVAATMKTLTFIDRKTSKNKAMVALVEEMIDGEWVCKWYNWSTQWTLSSWKGDIAAPANLTAEQKEFRPIVPRRHALGHKRLADTAAAMIATLVTRKMDAAAFKYFAGLTASAEKGFGEKLAPKSVDSQPIAPKDPAQPAAKVVATYPEQAAELSTPSPPQTPITKVTFAKLPEAQSIPPKRLSNRKTADEETPSPSVRSSNKRLEEMIRRLNAKNLGSVQGKFKISQLVTPPSPQSSLDGEENANKFPGKGHDLEVGNKKGQKAKSVEQDKGGDSGKMLGGSKVLKKGLAPKVPKSGSEKMTKTGVDFGMPKSKLPRIPHTRFLENDEESDADAEDEEQSEAAGEDEEESDLDSDYLVL